MKYAYIHAGRRQWRAEKVKHKRFRWRRENYWTRSPGVARLYEKEEITDYEIVKMVDKKMSQQLGNK